MAIQVEPAPFDSPFIRQHFIIRSIIMTEQRQEAYLELIRMSLNNPEEEKTIEILNTCLDLVDKGLVETIQKIATIMVDRGESWDLTKFCF